MTRPLVDDANPMHAVPSDNFGRSQAKNHAHETHNERASRSHFLNPQSFWDGLKLGLQAVERRALAFKWPQGLVHEVVQRLVLFINHVLLHEPQALSRLKRQKGRTLSLKWQGWHWRLRITPAGLLESDSVTQDDFSEAGQHQAHGDRSDLSITLAELSLLDVASRLMKDEKPSIRIEGDVQLAAEVNWLVDHVQWDYEDDLSRIVGDANAHQVVRVARWILEGLKRFASTAYDRASALGSGVNSK